MASEVRGDVRALSDLIERYLLQLLDEAGEGMVEVRRCDLAEHFSCAPSQINYVLTTRFTIDHGYVVESRRGGGGFIRIMRVRSLPQTQPADDWLARRLNQEISQQAADWVLQELQRLGKISLRQAVLTRQVLLRETEISDPAQRDRLRAALLRGVLWVLLGA